MTPSLNHVSHLPSWKITTLGTKIELYSSATLEELAKNQARPILLMGGVHGDEPEGVRLAMETLHWLKAQPSQTIAPWICIPILNVDGITKQTRTNARGVDLNRNYPSKDWSPTFTKDRYFPGASRASEIEIQGVVEIIQSQRPRLIIHCHSYKPCIVGTGERATKDTDRLAKSSGFEAVKDIGYPTAGALSSYGWYDNQIPVICIEEDDSNKNLNLIWPRFQKGMAEVFQDLSLREEKTK